MVLKNKFVFIGTQKNSNILNENKHAVNNSESKTTQNSSIMHDPYLSHNRNKMAHHSSREEIKADVLNNNPEANHEQMDPEIFKLMKRFTPNFGSSSQSQFSSSKPIDNEEEVVVTTKPVKEKPEAKKMKKSNGHVLYNSNFTNFIEGSKEKPRNFQPKFYCNPGYKSSPSAENLPEIEPFESFSMMNTKKQI